jgi:hypothetical protein
LLSGSPGGLIELGGSLLIGIVGEASVAFPDRAIGRRLGKLSAEHIGEPAFHKLDRAGDRIDRAQVRRKALHLPA